MKKVRGCTRLGKIIMQEFGTAGESWDEYNVYVFRWTTCTSCLQKIIDLNLSVFRQTTVTN